MTNYEKIRSMSIEEFAEFYLKPFCDKRTDMECKEEFCCQCFACVMDWLEQEDEP